MRDPANPSAGNQPGTMIVEPSAEPFAIAIVCSRAPLPMTRADQMTVAHLIEFLAARGHRIDLYALESGEDMTVRQRDWLAARCRTVTIFPHGILRNLWGAACGLLRGWPLQIGWFLNGRQRRAVRDGMARVDIGYGYYIRSAEALRGETRRPVFLAMQLSQTLNTRRMVAQYRNLRQKLLYTVESRLLRGYEARIWRDFTRCVLIGKQDLAEIRGLCRDLGLPEIDNVLFGPHGTDIARFAPRRDVPVDPCSLVFNGVLRTYTNVHAITWFAAEVWPLVKARAPRATLTIVGRDPRPEIRALAERPGIVVTGEVRDPADYIAPAAICIDPVQAGAGMQNKLIEFMAMAKPVVATTVANEGIGATPGVHLVLADDPAAMADEILALFDDDARRTALGDAARRFVEKSWSWEAPFLTLEAAMRQAIDDFGKAESPDGGG